MDDTGASLPELTRLVEQRLLLLRNLAQSLESSSMALASNDAEAIARGAAHQAELCLQWSRLERHLRAAAGDRPLAPLAGARTTSPQAAHLLRLQAEWKTIQARIRHLTRVHRSLLCHLERSLAILHRVVESCSPAYTLDIAPVRTEAGLRAAQP